MCNACLPEDTAMSKDNDMLNLLFWLGFGAVLVIIGYGVVSFFLSLSVFWTPGIR